MMYYVFEGVGDDGFVEEGADHVEGITRVDDKTCLLYTSFMGTQTPAKGDVHLAERYFQTHNRTGKEGTADVSGGREQI